MSERKKIGNGVSGFFAWIFNAWKNISRKKKLVGVSIIAVFLVMGIFVFKWMTKEKENDGPVFEALVNVTDQISNDPAEDAKSSLKKGDVIAVFPKGHNWSNTEKSSYLILKLRITQEEAVKLTQAETKEIENEKIAQEDGKLKGEKRKETVRARAYRLKIEKLNFDAEKFWSRQKQPYENKIFDNRMIEKK